MPLDRPADGGSIYPASEFRPQAQASRRSNGNYRRGYRGAQESPRLRGGQCSLQNLQSEAYRSEIRSIHYRPDQISFPGGGQSAGSGGQQPLESGGHGEGR